MPRMSPRPCPPHPTTARFSLSLAAVEAALAFERRSGQLSVVCAMALREAARKLRREELTEERFDLSCSRFIITPLMGICRGISAA